MNTRMFCIYGKEYFYLLSYVFYLIPFSVHSRFEEDDSCVAG